MNEEIKKELLNLAEAEARSAVDSVFKIIEIYVKETETKLDDAVLVFLPQAKEFVLKYVDKISE